MLSVVTILQGKTVVVSGVGPGLGREIAAIVVRDGGNAVLGARTEDRLASIAADIDPTGERVAHHRLDISDPALCEAILATAVDRFGGVDAVVNAAAIDYVPGAMLTADIDAWTPTFDVNVVGTLHLFRAAVPHLRARGGGALVMIGSQSAILPPAEMPMAPYAATKAALESIQRYMAQEVGPDRIRVNTVVPSWMWGPPVQFYVKMTADAQGVSEADVIASITKNLPLGEITADEDVAECVAFLCSDRARMITGQSILVNAGEVMR